MKVKIYHLCEWVVVFCMLAAMWTGAEVIIEGAHHSSIIDAFVNLWLTAYIVRDMRVNE